MSDCKECLAYQIKYKKIKPLTCEWCGQKSLYWKQNEYGTFYLECSNSNCDYIAYVDLNTPCEKDYSLWEPIIITVHPQEQLPKNELIIELSKTLHTNALAVRKKLLEGFSFEVDLLDLNKTKDFLQKYNIFYSVSDPSAERKERYFFYKECHYPYSAMKSYLKL